MPMTALIFMEIQKISFRFIPLMATVYFLFAKNFTRIISSKITDSLLAIVLTGLCFYLFYKFILIKLIENKEWFKVILYSQIWLLILIINLVMIFVR
jgi:hypothetical protein